MSGNVDIAIRYHEAVAKGEDFTPFLHDDMLHRELPNALFPHGAERDATGMVEAARAGREKIGEQRFDILKAVAQGDTVALEVLWTGTLAVPLGPLPAGHVIRAHIATFLDFRDGKIISQRNYDCYEPLTPPDVSPTA